MRRLSLKETKRTDCECIPTAGKKGNLVCSCVTVYLPSIEREICILHRIKTPATFSKRKYRLTHEEPGPAGESCAEESTSESYYIVTMIYVNHVMYWQHRRGLVNIILGRSETNTLEPIWDMNLTITVFL